MLVTQGETWGPVLRTILQGIMLEVVCCGRSEGRSSRGISSPGGGADQDQVFPCRAVPCRAVACRRQIPKKSQKVKISENKNSMVARRPEFVKKQIPRKNRRPNPPCFDEIG